MLKDIKWLSEITQLAGLGVRMQMHMWRYTVWLCLFREQVRKEEFAMNVENELKLMLLKSLVRLGYIMLS